MSLNHLGPLINPDPNDPLSSCEKVVLTSSSRLIYVRAAGLRVQGLAESDEPASRRRVRALLFRNEKTGTYVLRS